MSQGYVAYHLVAIPYDHTFTIENVIYTRHPNGMPDTFEAACQCSWKSRVYRTHAMAYIAGANHVSTIEHLLER